MDEEAVSQTNDDAAELENQDEVVEESTSDENLNNENQEVEETVETTEETQETEEEATEEELSPRQQKRVEQLKQSKLDSILDRVTQGKTQSSTYKPLDYKETIDADEQVITQLSNDREQYATSLQEQTNERLTTELWKRDIKSDLALVKDKLDKLDPSDARAIDKEYLLYSGYDPQSGRVANPTIGYAEFVEAQIDRANKIASNLNVRTQQNVAKQAAQTGLRPTGGASKATKISSADDIANISDADWEKNRDSYLKQMGITKR
jgi:hypothetical protein